MQRLLTNDISVNSPLGHALTLDIRLTTQEIYQSTTCLKSSILVVETSVHNPVFRVDDVDWPRYFLVGHGLNDCTCHRVHQVESQRICKEDGKIRQYSRLCQREGHSEEVHTLPITFRNFSRWMCGSGIQKSVV